MYKGERFKRCGVLDIKTHIKPTNKQLYVHASSYHPKGTGKGIVLGEALRYLRTNSDEENYRRMISKHKSVLRRRGYILMVTNKHLERISFDERQTTLASKGKSSKCDGEDPSLTFVTTFNDATPEVRKIIFDLWPKLHDDGVLKNHFPKPPIMALRKNPSIANKIVKSKPNPISGKEGQPQPPIDTRGTTERDSDEGLFRSREPDQIPLNHAELVSVSVPFGVKKTGGVVVEEKNEKRKK